MTSKIKKETLKKLVYEYAKVEKALTAEETANSYGRYGTRMVKVLAEERDNAYTTYLNFVRDEL